LKDPIGILKKISNNINISIILSVVYVLSISNILFTGDSDFFLTPSVSASESIDKYANDYADRQSELDLENLAPK